MDLNTTLETIHNSTDSSAYLATLLQVKGKAAGTESLLKVYTQRSIKVSANDDSDDNEDVHNKQQTASNK